MYWSKKVNKPGFFVEKQKQLSVSAEKSAKFEEGGKEKKKKERKEKWAEKKLEQGPIVIFLNQKSIHHIFYTPFSFLSS